MVVCTLMPILKLCPQMGPSARFFNIKQNKFCKKILFFPIQGLILKIFENHFSYIYPGVKNKYFEYMNKIGPVEFALSLGLHNDNKNLLHFDRNYKQNLGSRNLKTVIFTENLISILFTITTLFLYTHSISSARVKCQLL